MNTLSIKIMRGIYYAYAIRLATLPGVWQGFVMLACMIVLTHFVSLGNVIANLSHVEVSYVGTFLMNSLRTTELWTLLCIGTIVLSALSFRFSIAPKRGTYELARV